MGYQGLGNDGFYLAAGIKRTERVLENRLNLAPVVLDFMPVHLGDLFSLKKNFACGGVFQF